MVEPCIESIDDLRAALGRVTFENSVLEFKWRFEVEPLFGPRNGWLVWVSFERPDTETGVVGRGRGRDEIVWKGASLSSVVKTAWLLVELVIRHELMEGFRFDGRRIFNPHNLVSHLAALQDVHEGKRVIIGLKTAEPLRPLPYDLGA